MRNGRDSSVWKSLAVAFGDGVAFGVGMKLSQNAARRPEPASVAEHSPATERLDEIDRRIARIEQAPPAPLQTLAAPMDRKVVEAVVGAVETQLKEQSERVDRRVAEFEFRITRELQTLGLQHETQIAGAETRIEALDASCNAAIEILGQRLDAEIAAFRLEFQQLPAALDHTMEQRVAAQVDGCAAALGMSLRQQVSTAVREETEQRLAGAVAAQIRPLEERLVEDIRDSAGRAALAASAAETSMAAQLASLRDELRGKDEEIAALRRQLAAAESASLGVLQTIGQAFQEAAARLTAQPAGTGPETLPSPLPFPETGAPEPEAAPQEEFALATAEHPNTIREGGGLQTLMPEEGRPGLDAPAFEQIKKPGLAWRIPLVSSFVLFAASLILTHVI